MDFVKNKYVEYGIFSVIFFITVFFSFFHLTEAPAVWYDEGYFSQIAENVSQHGIFGIQNEPGIFSGIAGITAGYPLIAPIALSYKIFGVSVLSGRFVSALYILAVILVVYFFVRRVFGIPSALGSALLLATFPVLYGGGKSILGEVPAFFYMILSLFFFERAILKQKKTDIALSGIFLGVMASAKVTFLLAGLPAFGFAVLFYRRHIPRDFKSIGIFLVGFCSAFSLWILTQFSANDTFSSVLKFYFDPYSIDPVVSNFSANILKFFTEISPLYLFLFTLVWAGAFCFRFVQKENIPFSETVSFIFTLLIYLVFLKSPGWYRYFFPAQLIVILFVPNAIFFLSRELSFHFSFLKKKALSLAVFLILFLSLIQIYQTSKSSFVASYYHSTRTEQIEKYFTSAPRNETYFLYNVPELVIFLPTDTYYQYSSPHIEQVFGGEQRQKIKKGIPDSIILSGGAYKGHEQDFAPYKKSDTIAGRYVVLKK